MNAHNPLKIYISGPLTDGGTEGDREAIQYHVDNAIDVGVELMRKGHSVYIPHLTIYVEDRMKSLEKRPFSHERWMVMDLHLLKDYDAIFYIGPSTGADMELAEAEKLGLGIFTDVEAVPHASEVLKDALATKATATMPDMNISIVANGEPEPISGRVELNIEPESPECTQPDVIKFRGVEYCPTVPEDVTYISAKNGVTFRWRDGREGVNKNIEFRGRRVSKGLRGVFTVSGPDDATMNAKEIHAKAGAIVDGDRRKDYGHPHENHGTTAEVFNALMRRKHGVWADIDAIDVCVLNLAQKMSREMNGHRDDNLVDIHGYTTNIALIVDHLREVRVRDDVTDALEQVDESGDFVPVSQVLTRLLVDEVDKELSPEEENAEVDREDAEMCRRVIEMKAGDDIYSWQTDRLSKLSGMDPYSHSLKVMAKAALASLTGE